MIDSRGHALLPDMDRARLAQARAGAPPRGGGHESLDVTVTRGVAAGAAPVITGLEIALVIAGTAEAAVSVLALPELLAGLAFAGAVTIILAGVRHAFKDARTAGRWSRQLLDGQAPVEHLPVADPLPPLPPMEAGPDLPAHSGDDWPAVRLPALPLPGPVVTLPPVLAGPEPMLPGPMVLESTGAGRSFSHSRQARAAARQRDPSVTGSLADAGWWAHHLINLAAVRTASSVLSAAMRMGWRPDAPANVAPLPNSRAAQDHLRGAGVHRPVHNSGHPNWNNLIAEELDSIKKALDKEYGEDISKARDQAAFIALLGLQRKLRETILRYDRVTMLDGGDVEDA